MIRKTKGFTILELVIIVTILAMVTAFSAPGIGEMMANNRIIAGVNDFTVALQLAKAESAARITPVTVCKKNAGSSNCAGGGSWEQGWIVFADANADAGFDNGEDEMLLVHEPLDDRITFRGTGQIDSSIIFRPSGTTSITSAQTLIMCDDRDFVDESRAVLVTITGRGNVMKASDTVFTTCL